ncbi:rhamnogalacturonan acetylesterase [Prosthecobacter fluviatilis]|uniref:Rhamnogalacturonan acetylesterase n=1 Tax=Prosthecobacter fluviatilis TaxID=445931 RepID=A0ABW0KTB6_9BACT
MIRRSLLLLALGLHISTTHADEARTRIALAGDSTVTDKAGWGAAFAKLLGPSAECLNFAAGGQSSKSFRDTGNWKKVIDSKPAYILIQFGHNDMPGKGPKRETDPSTTYPQNLTRFIEEARAIGAKPILVTSLARRTFDNGKIRGELKPWADAATKVATEQHAPLIDLFARSVELHKRLGVAGSDTFNPPGKDAKTTDRTHLNAHGAEVIATIIAEEIRKVAPDLAKLLK